VIDVLYPSLHRPFVQATPKFREKGSGLRLFQVASLARSLAALQF
jgi:hypothetical protein